MSFVTALGYIGFAVSDTDQWRTFSQDILGTSVKTHDSGVLDLRIDDYAWRMRLHSADKDDLMYLGWELAGPDVLRGLIAKLESVGVDWQQGTKDEIESRQVVDMLWFLDPDGNRCEAFYGPLQLTDQPFVSPKGFTFNTGEQGLGHIVLVTRDNDAMSAFYQEVLGLKLSDYINTEVVPGRPLNITFLRCNGRHHSLALAPVPIPAKVAHIMFEVTDIDQVGRAMDAALKADVHLSFTLGRHSNDNMLSFYALSPSGFDVEFGWGGLEVDDDSWHVKTHKTNSAWGHRFQRPPKKS